jgi:hypothetical protein
MCVSNPSQQTGTPFDSTVKRYATKHETIVRNETEKKASNGSHLLPHTCKLPTKRDAEKACSSLATMLTMTSSRRPTLVFLVALAKSTTIGNKRGHLKPSTSSTTLPPGRVGRNGGDVLDSSDPHTGSSKTSESRLGTGSGLLGTSTTGSSELDVEGGDTDFLALGGNVLRGQHGGVGLRTRQDEGQLGSDSLGVEAANSPKTRLGQP